MKDKSIENNNKILTEQQLQKSKDNLLKNVLSIVNNERNIVTEELGQLEEEIIKAIKYVKESNLLNEEQRKNMLEYIESIKNKYANSITIDNKPKEESNTTKKSKELKTSTYKMK
jgi:hypothetical protein